MRCIFIFMDSFPHNLHSIVILRRKIFLTINLGIFYGNFYYYLLKWSAIMQVFLAQNIFPPLNCAGKVNCIGHHVPTNSKLKKESAQFHWYWYLEHPILLAQRTLSHCEWEKNRIRCWCVCSGLWMMCTPGAHSALCSFHEYFSVVLIKSEANLILLDFHFVFSFILFIILCSAAMSAFSSSFFSNGIIFSCWSEWRKWWWKHDLTFGINRSASGAPA